MIFSQMPSTPPPQPSEELTLLPMHHTWPAEYPPSLNFAGGLPPTPTPAQLLPQPIPIDKSPQQPFSRPPTPAPSPRPDTFVTGQSVKGDSGPDSLPSDVIPQWSDAMPAPCAVQVLASFSKLLPGDRLAFISALMTDLSLSELCHINQIITPRLKRDFIRDLPIELSLHILSFVEDARTLARASQVSRFWKTAVEDEYTWKEMCEKHHFVSSPPPDRIAFFKANRERRHRADTLKYSGAASSSSNAAVQNFSSFSSTASSSTMKYGGGDFEEIQQEHLSPMPAIVGPFSEISINNNSWISQLNEPEPVRAEPDEQSWLTAEASAEESTSSDRSDNAGMKIVGPSPSANASPSLDRGVRRRRVTSFQQYHKPSHLPVASDSRSGKSRNDDENKFSYKSYFKRAYLTESNWLRGGHLVSSHVSPDDGAVTSLALNSQYIVVGMADRKIHIFDAVSGRWTGALEGHDLGVWSLVLVNAGGGPVDEPEASTSTKRSRSSNGQDFLDQSYTSAAFGLGFNIPESSANGSRSPPTVRSNPSYRHSSNIDAMDLDDECSRPSSRGSHSNGKRMKSQYSNNCGSTRGFGQPGALIISGGCDRDVRVWEAASGKCLHVLRGHTSTIRCLKVIPGKPIAVSGSRDCTLRVWDIQRGILLHVLTGHTNSVRAVEVHGNRAASGSYDASARLWDLDTGECLRVFRGHYHQIYAIAFDGVRIATGSLDSAVRVWNAETGECMALLQGHTSLVGQLQLTDSVLVTGGSDGRVIVFSLSTYECLHKICAHDNSVTCLQFDERFIVSGGNDGRVRLWDFATGKFIRDLSEPRDAGDAVWRVSFVEDKCVLLCKKKGKTVMEVIGFSPQDDVK